MESKITKKIVALEGIYLVLKKQKQPPGTAEETCPELEVMTNARIHLGWSQMSSSLCAWPVPHSLGQSWSGPS